MITKKNYFSYVCIVYTILSIMKVISEAIVDKSDEFYSANFLYMFFVCALATFILSLHQFLPNVPLLLVIIGQYVVLVAVILFSLYLLSFFSPVSLQGYWEMLRSITIPYVVIAAIYYINYFKEVREANEVLKEFRTQKKEQ